QLRAHAVARPQAQSQVDLAAADLVRDALAQGALARAQLLRKAQRQLEEAVVDRTQLAAELAGAGGALAGGEGGHAADHGDASVIAAPSGPGANGNLADHSLSECP